MKYFKQVPNLKFDINKLQKALEDVLKIQQPVPVDNNDPQGTRLINLTQIPNIEPAIEKGRFWTKDGDHTIANDNIIPEHSYTKFVEKFQHTYFYDVWQNIVSKWETGRCRLLWNAPRRCLSWHKDTEPRLHLAIVTNPGARMIIKKESRHIPANGKVWYTQTTRFHNICNGGNTDRIHLVITLP
jgi:hypothetical protein